MIAQGIANLPNGTHMGASQICKAPTPVTLGTAAKMMSISTSSASSTRTAAREAPPIVVEMVRAGQLSVHAAQAVAYGD
jgi:hypothetical protein